MTTRVNINGEIYHVEGQYATKSEANKRAEITRKTKIFKNVRVILTPKWHPDYKKKYSLCVRGVNRDPSKLTAEQLMKETGLSGRIKW
jgi:hypothetical protein